MSAEVATTDLRAALLELRKAGAGGPRQALLLDLERLVGIHAEELEDRLGKVSPEAERLQERLESAILNAGRQAKRRPQDWEAALDKLDRRLNEYLGDAEGGQSSPRERKERRVKRKQIDGWVIARISEERRGGWIVFEEGPLDQLAVDSPHLARARPGEVWAVRFVEAPPLLPGIITNAVRLEGAERACTCGAH